MTDNTQAAIKLLRQNLSVIKQAADARGRPNLKQQAEECLALLKIIEKETDK